MWLLQNISFFIEIFCYNPPHENIEQIHIKANFDRIQQAEENARETIENALFQKYIYYFL